jgi:Npun R1517
MGNSKKSSLPDDQVGIYECEVRLKFRIIEDKMAMSNEDDLLEALVEAYSYGNDEYLESVDSQLNVQQIQDADASPALRRQLMRLRNSGKLA